ncbi:MAG TPA: hypothetical protein VN132_07530 [Bdellovibrio sp.]|nr:hypothetical protein [Bdellovibrio sp.]
MKQLVFIISLVVMSSSAHAVSGLNPAINVTKVYEFWMGKSADCSDLQKIVDLGTSGKDVDTEQSLDIGAGTLPSAGTYNCLAIVVSDTPVLKPATTGGACDSTHFYAHKTFRGASTTILPSDKNTTISPIGTDGSTPQKVAAYFSTDANANGGGTDGGHMPPWASTGSNAQNFGAPLSGGAVTVGTASMSKTFFVDCSAKVDDAEVGVWDVTGNANMGANGCATASCIVGFR